MLCLIYILRNTKNNLVYIGQTWRPLKTRFRAYSKAQAHLFNAIKLYGKENFFYEILTVANTQEIADYWESYFISKFDSSNPDKGYNLTTGGVRGSYVRKIENGEFRDQWIEKLRRNGKFQYENNKITRAVLEKNRFLPGRIAPNKGKPMSDEQYNKWLPYGFKKGEHVSPNTEFKPGHHYSVSTEFKTGQIAHNKGKPMSEKQKIRCAPTMFKPGQEPHNKKFFSKEEEIDIISRSKNGEPVASIARSYNCGWRPIKRIITSK